MAIYEDFDLDITTGTKVADNVASVKTLVLATCTECRTDYDTCEMACSVTCTGVRTMPCDR